MTSFETRRLTAVLGAEITGLPRVDTLDDDQLAELLAAVHEHQVVFVRDQDDARHDGRPGDTPQWGALVWGGFGLAMVLTGWGLWRMEINPTYKAFLAVSWLFMLSSAFTLAKTLRDAHAARGPAARALANEETA